MRRLLLIDDDEHLGPPLAAWFRRYDIELQQALRPSQGLALLRGGGFDAAILDVMLPEMDGFELCRTIRKESALPLIMLTARGDVMDRVVGLELGADDYLPKPFEPRELLARLQTILRRSATAPAVAAGTMRFEGLEIDLDRARGAPPGRAGGAHRHRVRTAGDAGRRAGQGLQPRRHPDPAARPRGRGHPQPRGRHPGQPPAPQARAAGLIRTLRNAGYRFAGVRA
jgi:CheY-like chemotaxis protein